MRASRGAALFVAAGLTACSPPPTTGEPPDPFAAYFRVPASPQRPGDPEAGYRALVNNGYVSCGLPYSLYARFLGDAPASERLPGRDGHNATMPYWQTAFTASSGVEVVAANCLTCHAGR